MHILRFGELCNMRTISLHLPIKNSTSNVFKILLLPLNWKLHIIISKYQSSQQLQELCIFFNKISAMSCAQHILCMIIKVLKSASDFFITFQNSLFVTWLAVNIVQKQVIIAKNWLNQVTDSFFFNEKFNNHSEFSVK